MNLVSEKRTIPEIHKKERCFSGVFFSLLTSCSDDVQNKKMFLMQKAVTKVQSNKQIFGNMVAVNLVLEHLSSFLCNLVITNCTRKCL
jgi:hypothetical protein